MIAQVMDSLGCRVRSGAARRHSRIQPTAATLEGPGQRVEASLAAAVTQRVLELIKLRCSHPAVDGTLSVEALGASGLRMARANGGASCALEVDLGTAEVSVTAPEERELVAKRP
jgi:hypothetical protein